MSAPEDDSQNDATLIGHMAKGDRRALARLYDRHSALLLAVARRILGDRRAAEDLVHDVFLEVWRRAADFDAARGSARTWIMMRLRSRALDRKRASRRASLTVALDEKRAGELEQPAAAEDPTLAPDRLRVRAALAVLPEEQRVVLELGYYEGLSSSEIAARLECPIGTVKSRVAAAIAKLRAKLACAPDGSKATP